MPKINAPIPVAAFRSLSREGLHSLGGIPGLYLRIQHGRGTFVFRFVGSDGLRHQLTIGRRSEMTLTKARAKVAELRALNNQKELVVSRKKSQVLQNTFAEVAKKWVQDRRDNNYWKRNPRKGPQEVEHLLRSYINPVIGNVDVSLVTPEMIRDVVEPIWSTKTTMARKSLRAIRAVLDWAYAMHYRHDPSNPADMKGPLKILMQPFQDNSKVERNYSALAHEEIPAFMKELSKIIGMGARATMFAILTAARFGSVRKAQWSEIDFEKRIWTIPPEHDKVKTVSRDRRIFLSEEAVLLLKKLPRRNNLLFPAPRKGGMLCDAASSATIKDLHERMKAAGGPGLIDKKKSAELRRECVITIHGTARSGFRTWAKDDHLGNNRRYDQEAAELCLLHVRADMYKGAYDRSTLEKERRRLMDDWGKYCCSEIQDWLRQKGDPF